MQVGSRDIHNTKAWLGQDACPVMCCLAVLELPASQTDMDLHLDATNDRADAVEDYLCQRPW